MQKRGSKKIVIGVLCALMIIMAVGYAALSQVLQINGTSGISGDFKIEFTKIDENTMVNSKTVTKGGIGTTTANFTVDLDKPGSSALYDLTVENKGSIDAILTSIEGLDESNEKEPVDIIYSIEGINEGDALNEGDSKSFKVRVVWKASATSVPTTSKTLTLKLNYEQRTGATTPTKVFEVGEEVYFNPVTGESCEVGSEWTSSNPNGSCYKWNVIKDHGNDVDMIVDHNLANNIAWISKEDYLNAGGNEAEYGSRGNNKYGPITLLKHLKSMTDSWSGVETLTSADSVTRENASGGTYTINYDGYKARLFSAEEVAMLAGASSWNQELVTDLPSWMYANLLTPKTRAIGPTEESDFNNYATDTSFKSSEISYGVWFISWNGALESESSNINITGTGIRPIVKVSKSNL